MARIKVKAIIAVDMPEPKEGAVKQTPKERREELREHASSVIIDALTLAELNPSVIRLNLSREKKTKGQEKADE